MRTRTATVALLAAAALGLGACGDDDDSTADNSVTPVETATVPPPATTETTTETTTTPASGGKTIQKLVISKDLKSKPSIAKPSGEPPAELYSRDIVKGEGKAAKSGDNVTVQYVGVSFSSGEQFDASWDAGQPFQFQLGAQMVISGWDQGVEGMRKGGRRLLVIPPDLAYGPSGQGPIGPNETLMFVIDMEKIG
jgi:peptidylprolyl isomerase